MRKEHNQKPEARSQKPEWVLLLFWLLASGFWLPVMLPLAGQTPANEWRQFRGNPRLTGVAASAPPAAPKVLWTYDAGDAIDSSAAIANGVVYVGVGKGDLIAVDFATGKLRWKYSTGNYLGESSPSVGSDAVYIGDLDGVLHAVNTRDGSRLWMFKTTGEIKSSPIVVNDLVLVGSYDTNLYALEARTGKLRWKFQTDGMVHATPAVVGDLVFIAGCDEKFRAIRIADGKQAYVIDAGAYTAASPAIEGDRAYFGTFNYDVLALDLKARKVLWRYSHPDRTFPFYSSAAIANGRVILGGRDKFVHALEATTGKAAWTFETRARVDSSPVIAGGNVYIGSSDGRLYVLDSATGQKRFEFDTGGAITASPAIAAGRLVIGTTEGVLYCFG
ncbi:MAG: PQQ-binding-like beta-propeller repeat protein [Acidobacteria bacterium]|nr:PQQ-binding-like beta-propeller repeat protein [Acidobacteriota bacterium]